MTHSLRWSLPLWLACALSLSACGAGVSYYTGSGPQPGKIQDGTVGNVVAVATDTLLSLGGPVRTLIDANLPPAAQRPRQGLVPTLLDLHDTYAGLRLPVTGSNGARSVVSGPLSCQSGSGSYQAEFLNAASISVGDRLVITAQDCIANNQRLNGSFTSVASVAGPAASSPGSAWSATWQVGLSAWTQYDLIAPPIGMRAHGSAEFRVARASGSDAEARLTVAQAGSGVSGLNIAIIENNAVASERDLFGVTGWRQIAGSSYTSLDLTVAERFFLSQGFGNLSVRTSGETLSQSGALPTGLWYAVADDGSVAYATARASAPTQLLIEYAASLGGTVIRSFLSSWAELRNYL